MMTIVDIIHFFAGVCVGLLSGLALGVVICLKLLR